jgi:hypothetical protein
MFARLHVSSPNLMREASANNVAQARRWLAGNPVFEAGHDRDPRGAVRLTKLPISELATERSGDSRTTGMNGVLGEESVAELSFLAVRFR